jgi:hypothetical protein
MTYLGMTLQQLGPWEGLELTKLGNTIMEPNPELEALLRPRRQGPILRTLRTRQIQLLIAIAQKITITLETLGLRGVLAQEPMRQSE